MARDGGRWPGQLKRYVLSFLSELIVMKRGPIPMMTSVELERLSTTQLLARLVQLRQCEESAFLSDSGKDGSLFKDSSEWAAAYEH